MSAATLEGIERLLARDSSSSAASADACENETEDVGRVLQFCFSLSERDGKLFPTCAKLLAVRIHCYK